MSELIFFINQVGFVLTLAFMATERARRNTVPGSYERYRLTGWAHALAWPAYLLPASAAALGVVSSQPIMIPSAAMELCTIIVYHRRLLKDDDDNPWRRMRKRAGAALRRLAQRAPRLSTGPLPAGAS